MNTPEASLRKRVRSAKRNSVVTLVFAVGLLANIKYLIAQNSGDDVNSRPGPRISEYVFNGDLDRALQVANQCVETNKAKLVEDERRYKGTSPGFVDVVGLDQLGVAQFLVAKVEILTLKGAFADAEATLSEAENFDEQYPSTTMGWSINCAPLAVARAFLSEKKGQLDAAAAAYKAILKDAKEKGSSNKCEKIRGRLAIIAFQKGDYAATEQWSRDALSDPGGEVAFAMLLQHNADAAGAKNYFAKALKLMRDQKSASVWSMPVFYAELNRAKDGTR